MSTGRRGRTFDVHREVRHDSQTGRPVWRISPPAVPAIAPYMYINAFTPDERYVFYAAGPKDSMQLFRCEPASGETMQMTALPGLSPFGANVHPSGREIFYRAGAVVYAADVETAETRVVLDPAMYPELVKPGEQIMFSPGGRYFSFSYEYAEGRRAIARGRCDGSGYDTLYRHDSGTQHLMFANVDDDLLSFSMAPDFQQTWDLPDIKRSRTLLLDARKGSIEPLLVFPRPYTATHEYWAPDGARIYYHKKTRPTWVPTWICSIERVSRKETVLFGSDSLKLGHSFVNREQTRIVSDVQEPGRNPLLWIDLRTGEVQTLCWPNSSVSDGQSGHVHPSISPKGTYVLYTSDASGIPQVFLVPMKA